MLRRVRRTAAYNTTVIVSFKDRDTAELAQTGKNRRWNSIATVALRKLHMITAAVNLNDLKQPPGNQLEQMSGSRAAQHSIRINQQYRICFLWKEDGAHEVEIVDYHDERKGKK
jgi:proteic killer suppression protein